MLQMYYIVYVQYMYMYNMYGGYMFSLIGYREQKRKRNVYKQNEFNVNSHRRRRRRRPLTMLASVGPKLE